MNHYLEQAQAMKEEIIKYRRDIHQNPEVGDHLPQTTKYVMDRLREFGYDPQEICDSGIVALAGKKDGGKTFLLRADMDALPITEETDYSFKATNGRMHACGHDVHTAMLLGAAKLLKENENELEGTVKIIFQPNEEGFKGAKRMIQSGVLENPKVDAAMALHVHSGNTYQYSALRPWDKHCRLHHFPDYRKGGRVSRSDARNRCGSYQYCFPYLSRNA